MYGRDLKDERVTPLSLTYRGVLTPNSQKVVFFSGFPSGRPARAPNLKASSLPVVAHGH